MEKKQTTVISINRGLKWVSYRFHKPFEVPDKISHKNCGNKIEEISAEFFKCLIIQQE